MAVSGGEGGACPAVAPQGVVRDHAFHPLRVQRIVRETSEASTFVLDVPPELRQAFAYQAGQFCTFRVWVDGQLHHRCYSMSSAPGVDPDLQVTVKRVPGGLVSNWMIDTLEPGSTVETSCPSGVFCLQPSDRDVVAFAAGSGITPVFSLMKAVLTTSSRRARLLYANRDRDAVIFARALDGLAESYAGRLDIAHHLDVEDGFVDAEAVHAFLDGESLDDGTAGADCYICGPTPFMDIVEGGLRAAGVPPGQIHLERFTPEPPPAPEASGGESGPANAEVTIELGGQRDTAEHHPGATILQTARQMGMPAPFSCESGNCATCMARVVEGAVTMRTNNALTDDEVAEGWVLTCQSVPTTSTVHVIYED